MKSRIIFMTLVALCAAPGVASADDPPADVTSPRHLEMARGLVGELAALGVEVDLDTLKIEFRQPHECYDDIDRQQDLFFEPTYFDGLHALWGHLGLEVGVNGAGLRSQSVRLISNSLMAYYQYDRKALVFAANNMMGDLGGSGEPTVAHELVHAWQDQRFGLAKMLGGAQMKTDQRRVMSCVIEGHAELVANALFLARDGLSLETLKPEHFDDTLSRVLSGEVATLPYTIGLNLMLRTFQAGGWPAVTEHLSTLPPSTEQVLHQEKLGQDTPTAVSLPPWPDSQGPATLVHDDVLGELMIYNAFLQQPGSRALAYLASAGWEGDHLQVYKHGEITVALWRTLWDRAEDAAQFEEGLRAMGPAGLISRSGRVVDAVLTRDAALLEALSKHLAENPLASSPLNAADVASTAAIERQWRADQEKHERAEDGMWVLPRYGVRFPIPDGWEGTELEGKKLLRRAAIATFADNILAQHQPNLEGASLQEILEENRAAFEGAPQLTLDLAELVELDGREVLRLQFNGLTGQPGVPPVHILMVIFLQDENMVILTGSAASERWKEVGPVIHETFAKITFDAP